MSYRYKRDREDWMMIIGGALFVIALVVFIVVTSIKHAAFVDDCEDHGGHVVKTHCSTIMQCTTSGNSTTCFPVESCDEHCEGRR